MFDASAFFDPALPWSGRADELRKSRAGSALVTELGGNYDSYHSELANQLDKVGRPDPESFRTLREYLAAWTTIQLIVTAEHLLRVAREVSAGKPPVYVIDAPQLVSSTDKLMHVDDPKGRGWAVAAKPLAEQETATSG